ncbi:DUF3800 domain-containing protein [Treponema sp. UBA3813]|uniref:DUF3800 domain-containing protein n=1 Tax=Treponema sp. UBA3813 TaxID=1947715 RepID=UPI0025DE0ABB|nr:DUF3800 domain-containing protein [Treponema sp. UBA3813]
MAEYNIYCDESCYLQNDRFDVMGFGCICLPKNDSRQISLALKKIKSQYNCRQELKWIKVSPKNVLFYKRLADYFFEETGISFSALVVENKKSLAREEFNLGNHESFYYKMYYCLLRNMIDHRRRDDIFNVYFDIKDSHGSYKIKQLKQALGNYMHDYKDYALPKFQIIRSHESEALQLDDFLLGAVMYKSRKLETSEAKKEIVSYIESKSGCSLGSSNEPWNTKFNLFHFFPSSEKGA